MLTKVRTAGFHESKFHAGADCRPREKKPVPLRSVVLNERKTAHRTQTLAALEEVQFDHERASDDLAANLLREPHRSLGGAAGRQQIIDDQHARAVGHAVLMDLD